MDSIQIEMGSYLTAKAEGSLGIVALVVLVALVLGYRLLATKRRQAKSLRIARRPITTLSSGREPTHQ